MHSSDTDPDELVTDFDSMLKGRVVSRRDGEMPYLTPRPWSLVVAMHCHPHWDVVGCRFITYEITEGAVATELWRIDTEPHYCTDMVRKLRCRCAFNAPMSRIMDAWGKFVDDEGAPPRCIDDKAFDSQYPHIA